MQKNNVVLTFLVVAVVVLAVMVIDLQRGANTARQDSSNAWDFSQLRIREERIRQDREIGAAIEHLQLQMEQDRQREDYSRSMSDYFRD